jgi:hypothetical protein
MQRVTALFVVLIALAAAAPAFAQGRITGVVRDVSGEPIRGATVRAFHNDVYPRERTSTTDDKGRWVLLGLRVSNEWRFTVEAPGYFAEEAVIPVRGTQGSPVQFTLRRDPGPIPGALSRDIAAQLSSATALRDQGRLDDAIEAFSTIQSRNEKLTSVHLALAGVYRMKADSVQEPAAKRALLERAASQYSEMLKTDAEYAPARTGLTEVQAALSALN